MKNLLILFVVSSILFSCRTKEEKTIQENINSIRGRWQIQSFVVAGNVADSLKTFFKSGELVFQDCKYSSKNFKEEARVCSGDAIINGQDYNCSHRYFYNAEPFNFGISPASSTVISPIFKLTYGKWEFILNGDKLNARQITNYSIPNCEVSITAVRK